MATQSKFSQIYLRLNAHQRKAFAAWLPSQPGSEHTLALLQVWHADAKTFAEQAQQIPGMTDADGKDRFPRRLHYLKDALEKFLIWDTLSQKTWLQKALLAEAYSELALPEFVQETLSGPKMEEMEQADVQESSEIFARYMVSGWQIHSAILQGKHPERLQIKKLYDNFFKILISSILDIKATTPGILHHTPDAEILADHANLQVLQAQIPDHIYAASPNLALYLQTSALDSQQVNEYIVLNKYYEKWKKMFNDVTIKKNTYAISFYRRLRNGYARYCMAHLEDMVALEQLWHLWQDGLEKGYALIGGYLPENEWRTVMKIAKKLNISQEDRNHLFETFLHGVSPQVVRKMTKIYALWYEENYPKLVQVALVSPMPKGFDEAHWWEASLLGVRAAFMTKHFYKDNDFSHKVTSTLSKILRELKAAHPLDPHNPRIRPFLIECKVAKACTNAHKKADWEQILEEIDRVGDFPGKPWYHTFAKEMAQGLR